ncbi:MAG: M56 family metallopeptidase [Gemmataceae bacterium]
MLWVRGFAARLILPADLLPRLVGQQGDALLLHELAHWKRGDHWVRRLEMLVLGLYWWCPARLVGQGPHAEECEEECCDAWVVSTLLMAR